MAFLAILGQKMRFFGDGGSKTIDNLLQKIAEIFFFESSTLKIGNREKMTWAKFIGICREKSIGAYRGRVTKLKEELVNNVDGVHLSTRKVQLDSWQAVALYLHLANRDRLHLPGDYRHYLVRLLTGRRLMRMSCFLVWAFA